MRRSDAYDEYTRKSNEVWQRLCRQEGIPAKIEGRIRLDICFNFHHTTSDLSNRMKVFEDWLQNKFFDNDNQIDSLRVDKRIWREIPEQVEVCISTMEDLRFQDPRLYFRRPTKT